MKAHTDCIIWCAMACKAMRYCLGKWIPKDSGQEMQFLNSAMVAQRTRVAGTTNSGAIGEWAVGKIVRGLGLKYVKQTFVRAKNGVVVRPDGYIPELNLYIEVKSRAYFSKGSSWSEKLDHVARKYSQICGGDKKCIVVMSANQMNERCGRELLGSATNNAYIKDFKALAKQYGIVSWIPVTGLSSFLTRYKRTNKVCSRMMTRSMSAKLRRSERLRCKNS